jgi:hypothetical protein
MSIRALLFRTEWARAALYSAPETVDEVIERTFS